MAEPSQAARGEPTNPLDRLARKLDDANVDDADLVEVELQPAAPPESGVPLALRRLGDFELLERLGEGGMGAVYVARQRSLGKLVAVKVIRPDFAYDAARIARFRAEATSASKVSHPGIVSVLQIGEHEGVHFIVQELIEGGRTLGDLIDQARKAPPKGHHRAMAELFSKVADALEAVHQAKVLHRDLKPGNILITTQGEPKVADFGLAKDLEGANALTSGYTPGTWAYKSPEHIDKRIGPVDARSDVFSLGVTLHEALVFVRPFVGGNEVQIYARILHHEVGDLRAIDASVPSELSLICRKALEKEPGRRYQSMAEFAADLRRFLRSEPILAKPPSAARRVHLWAKRNVVATALSIASVIVVATASVAVSVVLATSEDLRLTAKARDEQALLATESAKLAQDEAARATRQAEEAKRNAEETALVAEFQSKMLSDLSIDGFGHTMIVELLKDLRENMERIGRSPEEIEQTTAAVASALRMSNPTNVAQRLLEKSIFEPAVRTLEVDYADKPLLAASIQVPLAEAYHSLGLSILAERSARTALAARRELLGDEHPFTLRSMNTLAVVLVDRGQYDEAIIFLHNAFDGLRAWLGDTHPDTLTAQANLGSALYVVGKMTEAEQVCRQALDGRRTTLGPQHPDTLKSLSDFASVLLARGATTAAEPLCRDALSGCRATLGDRHPDTLTAMNNLAAILQSLGDLPSAESLYREALSGCRATFGDYHPDTITAINNLATLLRSQEELSEAEQLLREAVVSSQAVLGRAHPESIMANSNLAMLLKSQGKLREAEAILRDSLAQSRLVRGDSHPYTISLIGNLAITLYESKRFDDAEPFYRELVVLRRAEFGEDDANTLKAINNLANLLLAQKKLDECESLFRHVLARRKATLGDDDADTLASIKNLAGILKTRGKLAESEPLCREAIAICRTKLGDKDAETVRWISNLAKLLQDQGKLAEAEPLYREALAGRRATLGDEHSDTQATCRGLVSLYEAWHAAEPDAGHDQQAVELRKLLHEQ